MKVVYKIFLLILCAQWAVFTPVVRSQSSRKGQLSAQQIARQTFPSVVVLIAEDRDASYLGSGFFVDSDLIVTNYHVIKGASEISVRLVGQKRLHKCSIVSFDDDKDLALLKVEAIAVHPLPMAKSRRYEVGETVYVAGNPEGFEGTFSQGIISALRGQEYLQITAPISHGSSGGPVLNRRGEVIGVAVGMIKEGQNLNFAIPIYQLLPLLARAVISRGSSYTQRERSANRNTIPSSSDLDEGWRLLTDQHYDEAEVAFKKLLRSDSNNRRALFGLATAYERLKKYDEAIQVYDDIIRVDPKEENAYFFLALLFLSLEQYDQALSICKRAIAELPKSPTAYVQAASMLEFQWKLQGETTQTLLDQAESILISATKQSDDPAVAYGKLGDLYCDYLSKCADGITYYKKAISNVDQTNSITAPTELGFLHHKLGTAYLKIRDRASAIREYKILKSISSTEADELFNEIYK